MKWTFTPAFKAALEEFRSFTTKENLEEAQIQAKFKELMRALGSVERVQNMYCIRNKNGVFEQFKPNPPN